MTMMYDTEGDALPNNGPGYEEHDICWDISMFDEGELLLCIPMQFDAGEGGEYNGHGVLQVALRDILKEYLDIGGGLLPIAAMLREFAEKYEAAAATPNALGNSAVACDRPVSEANES